MIKNRSHIKGAIVAALVSTAMLSCKKSENKPNPVEIVEQKASELTTEQLIKFMAEIGHVNADEIIYDEKEGVFLWRESKTKKSDLLSMYEQHQESLRVAKDSSK